MYAGRLLADDFGSMTARQFEAMLRGLLTTDSRVSRHFTHASSEGVSGVR